MAEPVVLARQAIARSPIPPAAPEAEFAGWVVSGRRSDAPLTLADWTPIAKVLLRAPLGGPFLRDTPGVSRRNGPPSVRSALGVRFGAAAHHDWDGVGVLVVGWGPDEWLALGPPGSRDGLRDRLARPGGTVTDVTHAYAVVRLTGDRATDVLAHECALDLSDRSAPDGSVFRTAVSGVAAGVIRDDVDHTRSYLVHCEWSLGAYVFESLLDAGNGWNMEVDGLRITQFVD